MKQWMWSYEGEKPVGWSYSVHTQMTCFQIIMKEEEEEKNRASPQEQDQFSHSSAQREVPTLRWEGWLYYIGPLKS